MKLCMKAKDYELELTGFAPWLWWFSKKMGVKFNVPLEEKK